MSKQAQQKIDDFASLSFSKLNADNVFNGIFLCLGKFHYHLTYENLIADEFNEDDLTHSQKRVMNLNHYLNYPQDILKIVSKFFNSFHIFVINREYDDGFILVGSQNNIYACSVAFNYIEKAVAAARENFIKGLKPYKKQSTIDEEVDNFMFDSFFDLTIDYNTQYDAHDYQSYDDYIKKHFKTAEYEQKLMLRSEKFIQLLQTDKTLGSKTLKEVEQMHFTDFPKYSIKKLHSEVLEYSQSDIVLPYKNGTAPPC